LEPVRPDDLNFLVGSFVPPTTQNETLVAPPRSKGHLSQPMNRRLFLLPVVMLLNFGGCLSVRTEPIEVKPIHVTVDVNVKVDRALEDFFGDLDQKSTTITAPKS
jgi:hypothetical protein